MFDEGHDVDAFPHHKPSLLSPQEEVIDLAGVVLRSVLLDCADGKAVQFAVVTGKNAVGAVAIMQRCHADVLHRLRPMQDNPFTQLFPCCSLRTQGKESVSVTPCPVRVANIGIALDFRYRQVSSVWDIEVSRLRGRAFLAT
jgi:hypothetical protein